MRKCAVAITSCSRIQVVPGFVHARPFRRPLSCAHVIFSRRKWPQKYNTAAFADNNAINLQMQPLKAVAKAHTVRKRDLRLPLATRMSHAVSESV